MKPVIISALIIFNVTLCAAECPATNSVDEEQNAQILRKWEALLREADHGNITEMRTRLSRSLEAITVIQELHENKSLCKAEEEAAEVWLTVGYKVDPNRVNAIKILRMEETGVGDEMRLLQAEIAWVQHQANGFKDVHELKGTFIKGAKENIVQRLEIVNRVESDLWVEIPLPVPQEEEKPLESGEKRKDNAEIFEASRWIRKSELKS